MKEISTVDVEKEGSKICRQCGKVNRVAKTGSLTSWLFADNRCQCQGQNLDIVAPIDQLEDVAFDGYEVISVLGYGGMGTVFKVKQLGTDSVFAIKLMRADIAKDPVSVKRFEQEVESCISLCHENLPIVYGLNRTADGLPYFVMDYLRGSTLQTLLAKEGFLEPKKAISIFSKVSAALLYAQKFGIVHRDIKPGNIFIATDANGEESVKVLDFGIARVLKSDSGLAQSLTSTGEIFGSPLYMSPEQCRGEEVDTRSDIYALGCVVYEMLCGKPPFQGKNPVQTILKHLSDDEPDPLVSKKLGVSNSLQNVVFKCLAKQPDQRYNNFGELQRDLSLLESGADVNVQLAKRKGKSRAKLWTIRVLQFCIIALVGVMSLMLVLIYAFPAGDIGSLTKAIEKNPRDWESYMWRAKIYAQAGRSAEALADNNEALLINPNAYWALRQRASLYIQYQLYDRAIEDASRAIKISPDLDAAYLERASAYMAKSKYDQAISDLTMALKVNPFNAHHKNVLAYILRAQCYTALGKLDRAAADTERAKGLGVKSINPEHQKWYTSLDKQLLLTNSQILAAQRQNKGALEDINRALEIDPKNTDSLNSRAGTYIEMGEREKADQDLTAVVELEPDQDLAYLRRGTNRMFMGRMNEAMQDLDRAVRAKPNDASYRHERGFARFVAGEYQKALLDFRKNLDLTDNQGSHSIPCAVGAYFCNRFLNQPATAEIKAVAAHLNTEELNWGRAVTDYLNDKISEVEFHKLSDGHGNHRLTRSNCYIGLKQYLNGDKELARLSFNWVQKKGDKTLFEYAIAESMLKKIASEK
ncbi:MAG: protein kinase [Candidatus Obscuribacterales bacterium]|nr:protein kinase [Candidatus Obscuribacterales bacterium]